MATSGQREGGRESAPPTPSTSSTEKKPQNADNDVQQLIGPQEKCCSQPLGRSATLKQEDPQPPHIKEEEEELWTTQERECVLGPEEADLTKLPLTGVSVKTEDHEDKPPESLHWLCPSDVQQLIGQQEEHPTRPQGWSSTLKQEDPQPPQVKKEEEELWITQDAESLLEPEEADLTKLPLTGVSVKTEDHEDKPPECSQLHHSPSEENRGAETPSSRSSQHMTTEADGDHCGGSQADNLLAPLSDSDDTTSHSPEHENWDDTQEPLSSDSDCEGAMRTHTDKHSEKKTDKRCFSCSACDKIFSYKHHLTQHMLTHTGEKPFCCSVCAKSFSLKGNLTRHMVTHTGEEPFSCSVCAKSFSLKCYLTRHMLTHTVEKPCCCSVCGQRFSLKEQMVLHMRIHTGEKPFSCSVCGKNYSFRSTLNYHMLKHTGEKPFGCSVCGQRFTLKSIMVSHMRIHTGEKPFSCSVCGKNYSSKPSLSHHMQKHKGEKPFGCCVCGERFLQKAFMLSHMRTHTGGKCCSFSVCDKKYSFKPNLTGHMWKHTEQQPSGCGKRLSEKQANIYHTCQEGLGSASDSQPKHYWNQKGFEWSF
ncbi:oocyte zinc finger protein XlCOF22-like [Dunckerocampus dactyliophorus]|uniref:oocyte zinc finger protein XlCOF22-like n=1 Tax=Dunckerocampus dactyliophorus TaxID=161453 RepID=UPI00240571B0|nr:oocyte zinc finger protein XlCOF22-like [Dunckerocampus dactyliophorus]